jgi:hypothetical protein
LYFKEKQEAERKRVEAQGIADYQRIISILTQKQLQYESIKAQRTSSITKHKNHFYGCKDNASVIFLINRLYLLQRLFI